MVKGASGEKFCEGTEMLERVEGTKIKWDNGNLQKGMGEIGKKIVQDRGGEKF